MFQDNDDFQRFLQTLEYYKGQIGIRVYGWCLMTDHVHLLIKRGTEDISDTMKRLEVSYARYYKFKYRTVGRLFQGRYKSEKVENDVYLLRVLRFIHKNPVKAGAVTKPEKYPWSSCAGYYFGRSFPPTLLNAEAILKMFSNSKSTRREMFVNFSEEQSENDDCLEDKKRIRLSDEEVTNEILKKIEGYKIAKIKKMPKDERIRMLGEIKNIEGATQRQLARIIGISQGQIGSI